MEIVRDSHSITFNYMFWEILQRKEYYSVYGGIL